MDRSEYRARHEALLARVTACPQDMDELTQLMQEYRELTELMDASPHLRNSIQMQALNAELLSLLMERLMRAFVASCRALSSRRS